MISSTEAEPPSISRPGARRRPFPALIVLAFLALGILYALSTPVFEASDEIFHYPVVKYIADGRGLPVQDPAVEAAWEQEGSQPPLYYALAALATAWIDTDDMDAIRWRNPLSNIGRPASPGNKNLVIHTSAEAFPWRGSVLAVHIIRLLSLLLQTGTVYLTYLISREVWPEREELAALAAALVAFNPMFLFIAGSVNNDNLIVPLATLVLYLLIRTLREGWGERPRTTDDGPYPDGAMGIKPGRLLFLGVLLGLAALTKLSGLGLLLLTAVVLTVVAARRRAWRAWVRWGLILTAVVAVIAGWWYVRNERLYGDPTGLNAMLDIAGRRGSMPTWRTLLAEFQGFRMSFWGVFGGFTIVAPDWVYAIYNGLVIAGIMGWGALVWRMRRRKSEGGGWGAGQVVMLLSLALWVVVVWVSLIRWTSQTLASQGRLIFPAIAAAATLLACGLVGWAAGRWRTTIAWGLGTGLFALAALLPFLVIRPAYAKPPLLSAQQVPASAVPADVVFGGTLRLLAHELPQDAVRPGEELPVVAYWQSAAATERDLSVYAQLWAQGKENLTLVGFTASYPGLGAYPTSLLKPGDVVKDVYRVPVEISATAPSLLQVHLGLFEYGGKDEGALPSVDGAGRPASGLVGTVRLLPREPARFAISHPLSVDLGGQAALLGYDLSSDQVQAGEAITLTLYWQALERMGDDYKVFVHLVGPAPEEAIAAQSDKMPLDGLWPTWAWEPGYPVRDEYRLELPADLPPGRYELRAGLYRPGDGWRVPVEGPAALIKESAIVLGQVEVP
jgi:4-amino-4-deoxy-L-arabinose transferase-like glycosyltransferase